MAQAGSCCIYTGLYDNETQVLLRSLYKAAFMALMNQNENE